MSLSNTAESNLMKLLFENTNWANVGDATGLRGSSTAGSFYVALYTSDPGEAGTAITNEATYTSYARVAVARSTSGWTVTNDTVANDAAITFPACTGGTNTITHFGLVETSSGAGELYISGALTASLAVSSGITPAFAISALTATAA